MRAEADPRDPASSPWLTDLWLGGRALGEEDLSGSLAGPHRLARRLARGGMADVYVADGASGRPLAVKVLRPGTDSPEAVARFARELRVIAALRHPGLVELVDSGTLEDGRPYLATALVAGRHLDDHCYDAALDPRAVAALLARICAAVQHAHARGVVHRDLKPANVIVTAAGDPVVLDFGVAALLAPPAGEATVTVGGPPLTPHYASPELMAGRPATPRCDVYALGVILRDLLADAAADRAPRLMAALATLVARATSADPLDRPRDAGELGAELERARAGRRVSRTFRWLGPLRRHRRRVGLAAAALGAIGLAGATSSAAAARARAAKAEALSVSEFLVRLLDQSAPGACGPDVTLPAALMSAEKEIPRTFAGKPEGEYRVCMAYGRTWARLGQPERAARHLERALVLLRDDPDAFPESIAWCESLLSRCRAQMQR